MTDAAKHLSSLAWTSIVTVALFAPNCTSGWDAGSIVVMPNMGWSISQLAIGEWGKIDFLRIE
jgi:hypothetical protein